MVWYSKLQNLFENESFKKDSDNLIIINEKIHLHRDIWESRQIQVISRIESILNQNTNAIYARNTSVIELDKDSAQLFLDDNHLMGYGGGEVFLGLRDDTEVVAVAVFSKILFMKYEDPQYFSVELERYCSLQGTTVVGGLDKLIKAYINDNPVDDIVTYIDKEWSDGSSFVKIGFEVMGETDPIPFVVSTRGWTRTQLKLKKKNTGVIIDPWEYIVENQGNIKMRLITGKVT
jgi:hypothetical protein